MQTNINIQATGANGESLEVLKDLIEKRSKVMNETTQQTCIAITIQVLKSLRAATRVSKGKIKKLVESVQGDLDISLKEVKNYFVGFKTESGKVKPCIRIGSKNGNLANIRPWWKINLNDMYHGKVYLVTLSISRLQAWKRQKHHFYMVAESEEKAKYFITERYNKLANRYKGLAKNAFTRAMMLTSDRPATITSDGKTYSVLKNNVEVVKNLDSNFTGSSGNYSITVNDNLRFAGNALKGGSGYVNTAMMKACNSINGWLNKYIENNQGNSWFSTENWKTAKAPFPPEAFDNGD